MKLALLKKGVAYYLVEENEISQELDELIRRSLVECFPADKEWFSQNSWWHCKPAWRIVAMNLNDDLVGHIAIVARTIAVGKGQKHVEAAGVQSLFVMPSYRGKGIADWLLITAMNEALERSLNAGVLFCKPELEKVYKKTGWSKIDSPVFMSEAKDQTVPIPQTNITMVYLINNFAFPAGEIHLNGPDW